MYLKRLKVQGFRSLYQDIPSQPVLHDSAPTFEGEPGVEIRLDRLTVLIGCNDAGKSSLLDVLNLVFTNGRPDIDDFHRPLGESFSNEGTARDTPVGKITILLELQLVADRDSEARHFALAACRKSASVGRGIMVK